MEGVMIGIGMPCRTRREEGCGQCKRKGEEDARSEVRQVQLTH